jgi:hypothetical protein
MSRALRKLTNLVTSTRGTVSANLMLEQLDRVFITSDWDELYPRGDLQPLSSLCSDHAPLLLRTDNFFTLHRRHGIACCVTPTCAAGSTGCSGSLRVHLRAGAIALWAMCASNLRLLRRCYSGWRWLGIEGLWLSMKSGYDRNSN